MKFNTYLPQILTLEEVKYFIDTIPNLKHKAMLSTTASSGLRISETCSLRYDDISRSNMTIHIRESKNRSDRYTILSAKNLDILTQYWYEYGKPRDWIFPGQKEGTHINNQSMHYVIKEHTARLGWNKNISCHTFRHCFGTFLYENGTDLNTIKQLMGHKSLSSTMIYLHLSAKAKSGVINPFDMEVSMANIQMIFERFYEDYCKTYGYDAEANKVARAIMKCKTGGLDIFRYNGNLKRHKALI